MSKFRRVEETQNVPKYIEERFADVNEDPYKKLREGQTDRQMKIASQEMGAKRVNASRPFEWERNESQAEFVQPSMMRDFDDQLTRLSAADVNPNSIRRMDTGYDNGLNTRSAGNQLFVTEQDALDLIRMGASMWNPDFDDVARVCNMAADEEKAKFDSINSRQHMRAERHDKWQKKASRREMMGRGNVLDRAGSVVRNSYNNEYVAESSFGIPDFDSVLAEEKNRLRSMKESRESRLELKRKGYSPEERQESFAQRQERAIHAARFQDTKIDWVDKYVQRYDEDSSNNVDLSNDLRRS